MIPAPTLGESAYLLRHAEGLTWRHIGKRLGCPTSDCRDAAESYALSDSQPWPVLRRVVHRRRAYELRVEGGDWATVGTALNLCAGTAQAYAQEHAHLIGASLPPPPTPPNPTGRRAYELREIGFAWEQVAREFDTSIGTASRKARTHAETEGIAWPIPRKAPRLSDADSKLAARVYTELSLGIGWGKTGQPSWRARAMGLGMGRTRLAKLVQRHAEQEGLTWPVPQPVSPQERAYQLKLSGLTWEAVLPLVKEYAYLPGVIRAARVWAKKNNLPWPIEVAT